MLNGRFCWPFVMLPFAEIPFFYICVFYALTLLESSNTSTMPFVDDKNGKIM
jgi:hypothetical protein